MNSLKKMFFVLVRPHKTFKGLKEKPVFIVPLVILIGLFFVSISFNATIPLLNTPANPGQMSEAEIKRAVEEMKKYGTPEAEIKKAEKEMREGPKPATDEEIAKARQEMKKSGMSEDQIAESIEMMENPQKAMAEVQKPSVFRTLIEASLFQGLPYFLSLLLTVIFFYVLAFGFHIEEGFKKSLVLVSFAWLPLAIRYIIQTIQVIVTKMPAMEQGLTQVFGVTPFSMEAGVSSGMPGFSLQYLLYTFLQKIDLFTIWVLILMVFGLIALFKLSYKASIPMALGYFAISVLVAAVASFYGPMLMSFLYLPFGGGM